MGTVRRGNLHGEHEREDQSGETLRAAPRCSRVDDGRGDGGRCRRGRRGTGPVHLLDAAQSRRALGVLERRRRRAQNISFIIATLSSLQLPRSWLNDVAWTNMPSAFMTSERSQSSSGWLNDEASLKIHLV